MAVSDLQGQLHDTQSSLAVHVDKVRALEGVLAEHDAMKREVSLLRELVEKTAGRDFRDTAREAEEDFGSAGARSDDDDDARSVRTIVPHELERVEEEDEDQIARQEQQRDQQEEDEDHEERRRRRVELGRPRTPEPMGLGMTHLPLEDDEDPYRESNPSRSPSVIDQLFERLTILSNHLESAVKLSGSLQAQHAAAQSTISTLESKVITLEGLIKSSPSPIESTCPTLAEPRPRTISILAAGFPHTHAQ